MIDHKKSDQQLVFKVQVVPRASRSEIVGEHNGALRIKIAASPVAGAANDELLRVIARALHVSRSSVEIASGHSSKFKQLRVFGAPANALELLSGNT